MIQETILYGPRDYPLGLACDWLREIASGTSATFRVLLWTNPKGFDVEKTRYGEREIELGYRPVEEDFLNEFQATGDRWRWERARNSDELQRFLGGEEFNAILVLGSTPTNIARKAVHYFENVPEGPKTILLEFNAKLWGPTETYAVWHYLNRTGYLHLLRRFVHLATRKSARKFLPVAKEQRIEPSVPIWEIPAHKITGTHIEHLFVERVEEGLRLDYKRAAAVSEKKDCAC